MSRARRALALILLACASAAQADCHYERLQQGLANDAEWEAIVRCRQDDAARAAGLPELERTELPAGQTEIRIRYSAYGLFFDPMLRLVRRPRGSVEGPLHYEYELEDLDATENRDLRRWLRQVCVAPSRGGEMGSCRKRFQHAPRWREIYERLERLDIESIPDQSELPPLPPSDDLIIPTHTVFVTVEVRNANGYRRYRYDLTRGPQSKAPVHADREILKLLETR
jgi:hypothetical protein